jgi:hypothetical protein
MAWELRTKYNLGLDTTDGLLIRSDQWVGPEGRRWWVKRLEIVEDKRGEPIPDDALTFSSVDWQRSALSIDEFLQAMLEDAWKRGMRPKGFTDVARGELKAMGEHLIDLRKVAFHSLKMDKP